MDDLISRQAAIEAIRNLYPDIPKINVCNSLNRWYEKNKQYIECEDAINKLPSVQPERKKGKWIITDRDIINRVWHCNCSECGEDPQRFISGTEDWWINKLPNFCPNCGADMKEEKNDA